MALATGIALQRESLDRDLKSLEYDTDAVSSNIETSSAFANDDGVEIFFGYATTIPVITGKRAGKVMSISIDKSDTIWATVKMDVESDDMPWKKVKYTELEIPADVKVLLGQYISQVVQEAIAYKSVTSQFDPVLQSVAYNNEQIKSGFEESTKTYEDYIQCLSQYPKTVKGYFFVSEKGRKLYRLTVKSMSRHIKIGTDKNGHRTKKLVNNKEPKKSKLPNIKNCIDYATSVIEGRLSLSRLSPQEELGRKTSGNFNVQATVYLGANEEADRNAFGSRGDTSFSEKQRKRLIKLASKTGTLLDWDSLDTSSPLQSGAEAQPFRISDGTVVMKVVDPMAMHDDPMEYLDRIAMHNYLETNASYQVIGVTRHPDHEPDDIDGFRFVVLQPYIQVVDPDEMLEEDWNDKGMLQPERVSYMEAGGFISHGGNCFSSPEWLIEDCHRGNMVRDVNGTVILIDPIVRINDVKAYGGSRTYGKIDINDNNGNDMGTVKKSFLSNEEVLLMKASDRGRLIKKVVVDKTGNKSTKWIDPKQMKEDAKSDKSPHTDGEKRKVGKDGNGTTKNPYDGLPTETTTGTYDHSGVSLGDVNTHTKILPNDIEEIDRVIHELEDKGVQFKTWISKEDDYPHAIEMALEDANECKDILDSIADGEDENDEDESENDDLEDDDEAEPTEKVKKSRTTFTDGQRLDLAKAGKALPDGSFPIKTASDLKDAIKAVGRAKNFAKAKAHIMKRAKDLGKEADLPSEWKTPPADIIPEMEEYVKKSFSNPITGKTMQTQVAIKSFADRC